MNNATVSVIIPTYNREKLITKAIDSVMNQTYQDFDILIIDDASTDHTAEVIQNLNNKKIKYYKLDKNSGQCVARNYGIRQTDAKYIAFLDSDDEWLPYKLETQIDLFNKGSHKLGAVYGHAYIRDVLRNATYYPEYEPYRGNIHDKFLQGFCPSTPSIFLIKNEVLKEFNGFDEHLLTFVDLDMWLRISEKYEFDYVDKPVITKYEQIGDQYVNNFVKRYKGYHLFWDKWHDTVMKKIGKDGIRIFKTTMIGALVVPLLTNPPANLQKFTPKMIGLLLSVRSKRFHLYFRILLIMIFGPNIIYFLRKVLNTNKPKD